MKYFISWEIDIEADSAEAAALEALRVQRDPESIATVFHVIDEMGMDHEVDVADVALIPVAYRELKADARGLGGAHPLKHYQVELLREVLRNLTATVRTFRNVPKDQQEWTPLDDAALDAAFAALEATK